VFLTAAGSVLLIVDLQERLMPAIDGGAEVVAAAGRLAEAARLLEVPCCATEQYPTGLGPTVPELAEYPQLVMPKTAFAATADPGFATLLPPRTDEIVVVGAEAHVCVLQTVLGLVAARHRVVVAADGIGSRRASDKEVALDRMRRHGVEIVTSEMVIFEWLRDSLHPRFREVHKLIR
jgi:nicotinamidase-related amidase